MSNKTTVRFYQHPDTHATCDLGEVDCWGWDWNVNDRIEINDKTYTIVDLSTIQTGDTKGDYIEATCALASSSSMKNRSFRIDGKLLVIIDQALRAFEEATLHLIEEARRTKVANKGIEDALLARYTAICQAEEDLADGGE